MGLSRYLAGALLRASVGHTPFAQAAPVYLALLTTLPAPGESSGARLVEATYTGYARTALAATVWGAGTDASGTTLANAATIALPVATAGSNRIVAFAICDTAAVATGNVLYTGQTVPFIIDPADPSPTIPLGALRLVFGV